MLPFTHRQELKLQTSDETLVRTDHKDGKKKDENRRPVLSHEFNKEQKDLSLSNSSF